ncbi:hypothetical protein [Arthrobacter sp. Br18]|uniref:hypothetical protein n=1 Tax=Arthrobacter sp. Br18 TaxID=1312954 RepID=UPI000685085B|nr:hypothetical protein [Arthrobacter sp. Br18]
MRATDLAASGTRGRDLSIIVWSTTVGAVLGPNLFEPGQAVAVVLGLPALSGGFVFSIAAQAAAALGYAVGLRPDPLLTALERSTTAHSAAAVTAAAPVAVPGAAVPIAATLPAESSSSPGNPQEPEPGAGGKPSSRRALAILRDNPAARYAVACIAISHSAMVALMSMTPPYRPDSLETASLTRMKAEGRRETTP